MLASYVPLLILVALIVVSAVAIVVLSHLFSPTRPTPVKHEPYESGIPPLGTARERFDVKFYLVAVLFIVFDIEVVFMMPWAVAFRQLDILGLGVLGGLLEMIAFVAVLLVGYVYLWKRGALEWD
jgi:NADH-quinone oxidoreductase subunit A